MRNTFPHIEAPPFAGATVPLCTTHDRLCDYSLFQGRSVGGTVHDAVKLSVTLYLSFPARSIRSLVRAGEYDLVQVLRRGWAKFLSATLLVLLVTGCATEFEQVKTGTVYPETVALMASLNMDRAAPIMVRIYKEGSTLEVWKQDRTGRYRLLKSYPICRFSGGLGPKTTEGDHQAPEGFYQIGPGQMNPHSREYLSFNLGYPNAYDRSLGRTGDSLMVHGGCRSVGCYAMTDQQMEEIYGLAHEAFAGGQDKFQVEAFPFRMSAANLDRYRADANFAFWSMLKEGGDQFDATGEPPEVSVCGGRYVFNGSATLASLSSGADCSRL